MSLKAGRVGVAPSEVDEFGQIIGEITPTNVYTKSQADDKFETKNHASATYQEKLTVVNGSATSDTGTIQSETRVKKYGSVVDFSVSVNDVTCDAYGTIATLSEGFAPSANIFVLLYNITDGTMSRGYINSNGEIVSPTSITSKNIRVHDTLII